MLINLIAFSEENLFHPFLFQLRISVFSSAAARVPRFEGNLFFFSNDLCFCFVFICLLASFGLPVQQNFSNLGNFLDFLIGFERIRLVVHEFLQMGLLIHESFIRLGMKSECYLVEFLGPLSSCSISLSYLLFFICYLLHI